jgi:hypothetical protein
MIAIAAPSVGPFLGIGARLNAAGQNYPPEELTRLLGRANSGSLEAAVHTIGDAAVTTAWTPSKPPGPPGPSSTPNS